ncbi:MAG: SHOCT domain-containing protein [Candidatus Omnitrophica bacterium]|nr:SHOCT domain-containing protein [Candidatus Omnitrophota bacterium]
MFTLEGRQGKTVFVEGSAVKLIKRRSLLASQREKTIPIRNITSVEVKKPGALVAGFIQFSIAGGAVRDSSFKITGGTFDAVQDENSVVFADKAAYEVALQIKEYVENYKETPSSVTEPGLSAADEILKLKVLMDQGIISAEEFNTKKRQLLGI